MIGHFSLDHFRVADATGEDQPRLAISAKLHDLGHGGPDQFRVAGSHRKLAFNEFTAAHPDIRQVNLCFRAFADHRRQIALINQHPHGDVIGYAIKYRALALVQITAVEAVWRGGQANYLHIRIADPKIGQKLAIARCRVLRHQMRLVHQHQIRRRDHVVRLLPDRLNAGKGHALV